MPEFAAVEAYRRAIEPVTDQPDSPLAGDRLDASALAAMIDDVEQQFYVCGPPPLVDDVTAALESLGAAADGITFEE